MRKTVVAVVCLRLKKEKKRRFGRVGRVDAGREQQFENRLAYLIGRPCPSDPHHHSVVDTLLVHPELHASAPRARLISMMRYCTQHDWELHKAAPPSNHQHDERRQRQQRRQQRSYRAHARTKNPRTLASQTHRHDKRAHARENTRKNAQNATTHTCMPAHTHAGTLHKHARTATSRNPTYAWALRLGRRAPRDPALILSARAADEARVEDEAILWSVASCLRHVQHGIT